MESNVTPFPPHVKRKTLIFPEIFLRLTQQLQIALRLGDYPYSLRLLRRFSPNQPGMNPYETRRSRANFGEVTFRAGRAG